MPWYIGNSSVVGSSMMGWAGWFIIPLVLWATAWKGFALWHSAKRGDAWWFIAILFFNTLGFLELVYLLFVAKTFAPIASPRKTKIKARKKR